MKRVIFGLKLVSFFILSTIISLFIIFFLFYLSNLPQKYAIQFIEYYSKSNFNTNLKIRSISGNIFSNFSLVDIECFSPDNSDEKIFEINKATLHYNPFKAMINYRNIIQSIEFLGIDNMNYYLNREKNGRFQSISKKNDSKQGNTLNLENIKLKQKILFNNLNIIYKDQRGWAKSELEIPFKTILSNINGEISFQKNNLGFLNLTGTIEESEQEIKLNGNININDLSYKLNFNTEFYKISKLYYFYTLFLVFIL